MNNEKYILTDSDIEVFDDLFGRELTKDEFITLQDRVKSDSDFRYKYLIYRSIFAEIQKDGLSNEVLKLRFNKLATTQRKSKQMMWYSLSIAASLIICIGVYFFLLQPKNLNKEIYSQYKNSESGLIIAMGNENISLLDSAMIHFLKHDYQSSLNVLNQLSQNDTVNFYKGVCYEFMGKDIEAVQLYIKTADSKSNLISSKAKWRLSLLYIKDDNKAYFDVLQNIASDSSNPYQDLAMKIKKALQKN